MTRQLPGPDREAARWLPPGQRHDTPPQPVPGKIRKDKRQIALELDLTGQEIALATARGEEADPW